MGVNNPTQQLLRTAADTSKSQIKLAIELKNIHKRYGAAHVVRGLDIAVPAGAFLVLLGPSGCGKSTLLRMLSGLEAPSEGALHILGKEVANGSRGIVVQPGDRGLGLVFQSYALWPHMTVRGNVEWPLKVAKVAAEQRKKRVDKVLAMLGIGALAERYPNEISGGQQQRVAIARMLSPEPGLLLFDEPLSNLDAKLRMEMRSELLRVHRESGATSVYVTHDQVEAMTMATHVVVMKDGLVEQFGTPQELLSQPQTAFVATFVGTPAANVLPVQADASGRYVHEGVALAQALPGHQQAQLLYSAQDIRFTTSQAAEQGPVADVTVLEVAPMAGNYVCTVMLGNSRVCLVTPEVPTYRIGDKAQLVFPAEAKTVFDQQGHLLVVSQAT